MVAVLPSRDMAASIAIVQVLLWLALIGVFGWVATDAAKRGRNWLGWTLLLSLVGLIAIIPWLIVRRRVPVIVHRLGFWRSAGIRLLPIPLVLLGMTASTYVVTFLFQVARVEGSAMMPTLADQDRLIVNKLIYQTHDPQRGDIVMLRYPLDPDKTFVKRLVAVENDQVHLSGGRLLVNNVLMDEPFILESFRGHRDWGPGVVPQGYYFVLGDHRNNSSDSRHWGFVPKKYVLGRVQWRWWPVSGVQAF